MQTIASLPATLARSASGVMAPVPSKRSSVPTSLNRASTDEGSRRVTRMWLIGLGAVQDGRSKPCRDDDIRSRDGRGGETLRVSGRTTDNSRSACSAPPARSGRRRRASPPRSSTKSPWLECRVLSIDSGDRRRCRALPDAARSSRQDVTCLAIASRTTARMSSSVIELTWGSAPPPARRLLGPSALGVPRAAARGHARATAADASLGSHVLARHGRRRSLSPVAVAGAIRAANHSTHSTSSTIPTIAASTGAPF